MAKPEQPKSIYIAAPFFNEQQLQLVQFIEHEIRSAGLAYYSPRNDGVLKDMTPAERIEAGPKLFRLNCTKIKECDCVLALLDHSDAGTTWETGFAYGIGQLVYGYRTSTEPLNIMLQQCFDGFVSGMPAVREFLADYAKGDVARWKPSAGSEVK